MLIEHLFRQVKYLVISDLHLGENNNTVKEMTEGFTKYFVKNRKRFKELDILHIAGDLFHRLLTTNSLDYDIAMDWILWLVKFCSKHNIKLRILEGTPSHDWGQAKIIETIVRRNEIKIDFKYINTLSIEFMNDLGINVLYVPDEWHHNASKTLDEVKALLKTHKIEMVDTAVMHGSFKFQIPAKSDSFHDCKEYLKIVKTFISVGHVHPMRIWNRILGQGSLDRTAHGEEEPKGGMVITLDPSGKHEYIFVENIYAKKFITFKTEARDLGDLLIEVKSKILKLPKGSHIRILLTENNPLKYSANEVKSFFKDHFVKVETVTSKNKEIEEFKAKIDIELDQVGFSIHKENIMPLILDRLSENGFNITDLKLASKELEQVI